MHCSHGLNQDEKEFTDNEHTTTRYEKCNLLQALWIMTARQQQQLSKHTRRRRRRNSFGKVGWRKVCAAARWCTSRRRPGETNRLWRHPTGGSSSSASKFACSPISCFHIYSKGGWDRWMPTRGWQTERGNLSDELNASRILRTILLSAASFC